MKTIGNSRQWEAPPNLFAAPDRGGYSLSQVTLADRRGR
jgi:hypothetical protein